MSASLTVGRRWFKRSLVTVTILVVGLIVGTLVIDPSPAETQSPAVTEDEINVQRGLEASAARYSGLAEYYAPRPNSLQRGLEASAARYSGLAGYYTAREDSLQRGLEASAARYAGLAEYYGAAGK